MVTKRCMAFTLVELLVVVAIIALLLAILLPVMNRARDLGKTAVCANTMKRIGEGWTIFAVDNRGRGPGYAQNIDSQQWGSAGYNPDNPQAVTPLVWTDILNFTVMGDPAKFVPWAAENRPIQRFFAYAGGSSPPVGVGRGALSCPENANAIPRVLFGRPYLANRNMTGGAVTMSSLLVGGAGPYGVPAPNPGFRKINGQYGYYTLGTRLNMVKNPAYTYLILESSRGNDQDGHQPAVDPTAATVESPVSQGGSARFFQFRHPSLTANYLFVDNHVATMSHMEPTLNVADRFNIE